MIAAELKAIDLLGSSPPKVKNPSPRESKKQPFDAPDEASKQELGNSGGLGSSGGLTGSYDSDDSKELKDSKGLKRKKKVVTFVEYSNEPKGIMDEEENDEDDDELVGTPSSSFMALRSKRSASLPHIELNPKLNKKIKKMADGADEEDSLNTLLEDTLTLFEEKDKSTSELRYEYEFHGGQLLQVRIGNIIEETVDAIVNEANSNLQHNSGLAGVMSQTGGRDIQIQSDRWIRKYGPVPPGRIAVTEAGSLPAKRILHAVGPIWRGGNSNEDHEYWDAIWHCLESAAKHKFKSLAIPAIGIGFLGFPKERVSYLLVDCVSKFWMKHPKSKLREVRFVNFDTEVAESIVFEMVGKFTAGCETSESECYSESELESEYSDDKDQSEQSELDEAEIATASPEKKNIIANNLAHKKYMQMKAQARRQSIA